jgi:protein-tyrosine phosphatase
LIDTHCHLLPGIDDGPKTVDEAVSLARDLVLQGVDIALCTPHWSRFFPTQHADISDARGALQEELQRLGIPLRLEISAELSAAFAATKPIDEVRQRSVTERWVIVELVEDELPNLVSTVLERLMTNGLFPVLAHPERWRVIHRDPKMLDQARSAGALVQVVAPSLTGRWGATVRAAAWDLVASERADLLASDAHDLDRRRCELDAARTLVTEHLGSARWDDLTIHAPRRLLAGTPSVG